MKNKILIVLLITLSTIISCSYLTSPDEIEDDLIIHTDTLGRIIGEWDHEDYHMGHLPIGQVDTIEYRGKTETVWAWPPDSPIPRPNQFYTMPTYPNPTKRKTTIKFAIGKLEPEQVKIVIKNQLNQVEKVLIDEKYTAGYYSIEIDLQNIYGKELEKGLYRVEVTRDTETQGSNILKE